MNPFTSVAVGVASLDEALSLWVDQFGLALEARREGPDAVLARLWRLADTDIRRQALVATPGQRFGMIHLVEFDGPEPPVREHASATDCCPKNLDVYADNLPQKMQDLAARGCQFRNPVHSEVTVSDGTRFREAHMPTHDDINVVLLEVMGWDLPYSENGFAAVGLLITIVPDAEREKHFYGEVLGLEKLSDNLLQGVEVEAMVGLPAGAAMDASVWGRKGDLLGQVEVIEYRGASGADLYPRARPKSLGILHISFDASDIAPIRRRLAEARIDVIEHGRLSTLATSGDMISFLSPAGLRIEITAAR